jgi:hypothetical protein
MSVPNPRPAPVAGWRWKVRVALLTWTACGVLTAGLLFLVLPRAGEGGATSPSYIARISPQTPVAPQTPVPPAPTAPAPTVAPKVAGPPAAPKVTAPAPQVSAPAPKKQFSQEALAWREQVLAYLEEARHGAKVLALMPPLKDLKAVITRLTDLYNRLPKAPKELGTAAAIDKLLLQIRACFSEGEATVGLRARTEELNNTRAVQRLCELEARTAAAIIEIIDVLEHPSHTLMRMTN